MHFCGDLLAPQILGQELSVRTDQDNVPDAPDTEPIRYRGFRSFAEEPMDPIQAVVLRLLSRGIGALIHIQADDGQSVVVLEFFP